jgi:phosphoribosylanthranilate isomerase
MMSRDEQRLAVAAGADAVGLVGPMPSGAGIIDDTLAAAIARVVPPPVASVLLTSRASADEIAGHLRAVGATAIQIVRHVDPADYPRLRALLPDRKIIQVIHVEDDGALTLARDYGRLADALLLDSGRPGGEVEELGGTGRVHDWTVSARIVAMVAVPVFLAGGLDAGNVAAAMRQVAPYGIDVCSGVRAQGALDAEKLAAFVAAMRRADERGAG